jgi:uncharacterized protein
MKNVLSKIFNKDKNVIIGAIHFAPLLGYKDFPGYKIILKNALEDLAALQDGGVDGVIIENNYDIPHKIFVEKETTELMIRLGKQIKKYSKIPVGVSVLWNDYRSALLIAKTIGASFIRVPVFVDSVRTNYGDVLAEPKDVLNYRKKIGAENVVIFTDIHVKHAELLEKKSIEESARQAVKFGSNALIITGKWTGQAPDSKELVALRNTVDDFPILIGSGADKYNINKLFEYSNGAIVSTSLKKGDAKKEETNVKTWKQRINENAVKILIKSIDK